MLLLETNFLTRLVTIGIILFMMEIEEIIKKAGGCTRLARYLGITHRAVTKWKRVPVKRLAAVSKITGIPVDELRADLAQLFKKG